MTRVMGDGDGGRVANCNNEKKCVHKLHALVFSVISPPGMRRERSSSKICGDETLSLLKRNNGATAFGLYSMVLSPPLRKP